MNFDDSPHTGDFFVSVDKTLLDVPLIATELKRTYWGGWLTLPTVLKSIDNSLCFGLYHNVPPAPVQVGFARVVTDYATFAWVCDVIVKKELQRRGLGKFLMTAVMNHPDVRHRSCLLCTKDAQGLYRKFGFSEMVCMKRPGSSPDAHPHNPTRV
jgi:GNAT superfamily N-acetyltransferase